MYMRHVICVTIYIYTCVCMWPLIPTHTTPHHTTPNYAYFLWNFDLMTFDCVPWVQWWLPGAKRRQPSLARKWAHNRMSLSIKHGRPHTLKVPLVTSYGRPPCAFCNVNIERFNYYYQPFIAIDPRCSILQCPAHTSAYHTAIPFIRRVKTPCKKTTHI